MPGSVPSAAAEDIDSHCHASHAQSHAEEQERRPSRFDAAGEDVEVLSLEAGQEGDGQENGGTAASRRLTPARCLLTSAACRPSRAAHRSSSAAKSATTCASSSLMSSA